MLEVAPANMSLSKQQLASKLAKKICPWMKISSFQILPKQIQRLDAENLQKYSVLEKLLLQLFLKKKRTFAFSWNYFVKKFNKRNSLGKYRKINRILYEWYQRCCASNIYANGPMLKEEAVAINEKLQDSNFDGFSASDEQLDGWKSAYAIKER